MALVAAEQPENAVRAFMRGKLEASENVLEGLVTEDFTKIRDGADQMRVMSQQAAWNVLQTPDYAQYSAEFQRNAKSLSNAAAKKDLDAATLAYTQVMLTCVNCHKHVRGAKIADVGRSAVSIAQAQRHEESQP